MKKILVSTVAIVAALSLAACGGKKPVDPATLAEQFNNGEITIEELEAGIKLWNESIKED